jgi:hypothetical protein
MGCEHTHQQMLIIERWGNPSHARSVVQKNGEDNQKAGKTSQTVNQALALGPKHDKIRAQWAIDVSRKVC